MKKTIYSKEHKFIIEKLRKAREDANLGQIEVAKKLGRTQSYISKVETGQLRLDLVQLQEFSKLYKKDINYFISGC